MRTAVPARPLLATYNSRIKSFDSRNRCSRTQLVNAPNLGSIAFFTKDYAEHLTGFPASRYTPARVSCLSYMLICFAMQTLRNIHEHLSTDMRITFSGLGTSTLDLLIRHTSDMVRPVITGAKVPEVQ
ncbi:Sphingomyelin synthase-related [Trichinella spiralis]|uniref:Sphingomyelin synthase-related n=1 Tax=Trichinella spiralis TaxID=6334 RepID=A0ABR3KCH0_TRISP